MNQCQYPGFDIYTTFLQNVALAEMRKVHRDLSALLLITPSESIIISMKFSIKKILQINQAGIQVTYLTTCHNKIQRIKIR